jgi:hypothetical protein
MTKWSKVFTDFLLHCCDHQHAKAQPPKRQGASILLDQSPARRDQIRVKLSSPSPFTSEA